MRSLPTHRTLTRLNTLAACVLATFGTATLHPAAQAGILDATYATPREGAVQWTPELLGLTSRPLGAARPARVPARPASTINVTTCDDGMGIPGSLREALGNAVDGDVIDLTGLSCSTI